jgi:hypothetical protein
MWELIIGALGLAVEGDAWFTLLSVGPRSPYLQGFYYDNEHQYRSSPYGSAVQLESNDVDRYRKVFNRIEEIVQQETKNLFLAFSTISYCGESRRCGRQDNRLVYRT